MLDKDVEDHLNRPLGYEIAEELMYHKRTRHSIKRELPYRVHDEELNRILDLRNEHCDVDVFEKKPSIGGEKWKLNTELFTEKECDTIEDRARARILDNTQLTEKDLDSSPCASHMDAPNQPSAFYNTD